MRKQISKDPRLSFKFVLDLPIKTSTYSRGLGDGLKVKVRPNNRKEFYGRYYHNRLAPNGKDYYVGTFGEADNHLNPLAALEKWDKVKKWCIEENRLPKDYVREQKWQEKIGSKVKTLDDVIEEFLKIRETKNKETTVREYRLKLQQLSNLLGGNTPINEFHRAKDGARKVELVLAKIAKGDDVGIDAGKYDLENRCRFLLARIFRLAASKGYMGCDAEAFLNPVTTNPDEYVQAVSKHHPCLDWEDVDPFFSKLEANKCNMHQQVILCAKFTLLTFLRTGASSRTLWDWVDENEGMITYPGITSGLKRVKGVTDHVPHKVPITPEIQSILDAAKTYSDCTIPSNPVFLPTRKSRFNHLDPSAVNNFFRNLGYKNLMRAHGCRRLAMTVGKDILKSNHNVIELQMGHLPKGKVGKAYDGAELLEERTIFLEKWNQALVSKGMKVW